MGLALRPRITRPWTLLALTGGALACQQWLHQPAKRRAQFAISEEVKNAAREALEAGDVAIVLPFVPERDEEDVRAAFTAVMPVRAMGDQGRAVADRLFFETVVRIHRAGEGAPYTGLKRAGTPVSPVIPIAEEAVATGSTDRLTTYLTGVLQDELSKRLSRVSALAANKDRSVSDARRYVEAMLGFEVYSHSLLRY